ncbi:outer membrane beta-barrel protein [Hymenobacter yonginensis]|uniref:Outer membrane beta-barrel protein n=1 Tax=Hymenobacter yonginensis TaxID=748197 RepID=A0ABY7PM17_9BACT|nr:outer membrane beta-barrel protein [Hymenobacter yonginensis]WBO83560.1 outer membrane beta-barrel protein [Hymenobacter yonginensis]
MALSDPNHTPDPRPTGDLEHLFRQKFAEAEVTPRASLWEQLDHELLVQQNDTYRRRLLGYRWAAAASLLLLAGGGTWLTLQPNATGVASAPAPAAAGLRNSGTPAGAAVAGRTYEAGGYGLQPGLAGVAANSFRQPTATPGAAPATGAASATNYTLASVSATPQATQAAPVADRASAYLPVSAFGQHFGLYEGRQAAAVLPGSSLMQEAGYTVVVGSTSWSSGRNIESVLSRAAGFGSNSATGFGRPDMLTSVAAAPAASSMLLAAAAPKKLISPAQQQEEEQPVPARRRRWKLSAGYAASAFNPNINYSRASAVSSSNSVSFSPATFQAQAYEMAASEYRSTLQSGLGQQVAMLASYPLNNNWTVETGLAAGQQEATAASSWAFLDGKSTLASSLTADRNQGGGAVRSNADLSLRNVRYRYQTASVPVNVRYATNPKKGWALYAKVGAAVNVLLKSRTELEGVPEATTTYTLASATSPYRKVLGSVQSGAGVRYQPANATWRLALGPKVEAGLNSLNDQSAERFTRRSRPYSVGLEASVEFGNATSTAVARR